MIRTAVAIALLWAMAPTPVAFAVTVDADTVITWKLVDSVDGDPASVRTDHFNTLVQANGIELNNYTLVLDATMFRNSTAIHDVRVWDSGVLLDRPGTLTWTLREAAPCLLIEGTYQGRTIASAGPRPLVITAANDIDTTGPLGLNCPPPDIDDDPGCTAEATDTETTAVSLEPTTLGGVDATTASVQYPLARSERRGDEVFVMDEWAVASGGDVVASSASEFAEAVATQNAMTRSGEFLLVQEPVHVRNSRHVAKPRVRMARTGLPPSLRGDGQLVVARLEFPPEGPADRVELLYSSASVDAALLEDLLRTRTGLVFASEKRHRAGAYVVLRLGRQLKVLQTLTVLPQCCCGETFCA